MWTFGLCDLSGNPIGEITNAYERKVNLPLNALTTAEVTLRLGDALVDEVISLNGDVLLKVYQDSTLRFIGDLMSAEEVTGDKATMRLNFAGPLWRLSRRLLGIPYPHAARSWSAPADQIIDAWINQTNTNHESGIRLGTRDALYATNVGTDASYAFKPVSDALKELQEAKIPFPIDGPTSWVAFDSFIQSDGNLSDKTDDLGVAWDGVGDAADVQVLDTGNYAYRGAAIGGVDASGYKGRWMLSDAPDQTGVLVGMDYRAASAGGAGQTMYVGPHARHNDGDPTSGANGTDAWIWAYADLGANQLAVDLKLANQAPVTLDTYSFPFGGITATDLYRMRFLVDADGNYTLWHYASGASIDAPKIVGHHEELMTGGALASGKVGFHHAQTSTPLVNTDFDAFLASAYSGPQSFDFEIAPLDIGVGGETEVGELNVRTQIGSQKPNVIFEFGDGSGSMRPYSRKWSREGLCNIAYVLPPGFEAGLTEVGQIGAYVNQASIDARGQYEDVVPEDLQDPQLRLALAQAHAQVRGSAKQEITFVPFANAPEYGVDYEVGDYVTGRAKWNNSVRFNALFRVYGVEVSIDDNGKVDVVPTLIPS